ncbi:(2Fe-2S) ferredoxin domain-containing protein [Nocardiopsis kunsanensis]|uniref:(2Fe-2S) ferredoxin domain-containing protein n=1 Tax=Nocardiopsis kunsanensis TaxID=141693 RepID=UPI0018766849|nr:(2Fe-2S) ferredoxin domain-containing protein [Nocardiopsis kunsanensis]
MRVNCSGDAPCRLTVCRGCCCGTRKKVPGVDHEAQLARLSTIEDHTGRTVPVRRSDCLDRCSEANVVVVQPSARGRAAGGRPVWLGRVTDDHLVEALDDWIFEGGPGLTPLPEALRAHVISKGAEKPGKGGKVKKDGALRTDPVQEKDGKGTRTEKRKKREKADKHRKKREKAEKKARKKREKAAEAARRAERGDGAAPSAA